MNPAMYSQTDSRWRSKPYPSGGYTVGGSGCGLCAVTHILIEQNKYWKATPSTFWKYMRQYATKGHGTLWKGITNGLKHYGHKTVKELACQNSKSNVYAEFNKGNRMAVALFEKGYAPDGKTKWTNGGHYIAFIDYKVENGKHYFYVKDSGGKHRKGWYQVESQMGKRLKRVWIVKRLDIEISVDGNWSTNTTKASQKAFGITVDGIISSQPKSNQKYLTNCNVKSWEFVDDAKGSKTIKAIQKLVGAKEDGICGKATIKSMQRYLNVKESGYMDSDTVKAWQEWLNKR